MSKVKYISNDKQRKQTQDHYTKTQNKFYSDLAKKERVSEYKRNKLARIKNNVSCSEKKKRLKKTIMYGFSHGILGIILLIIGIFIYLSSLEQVKNFHGYITNINEREKTITVIEVNTDKVHHLSMERELFDTNFIGYDVTSRKHADFEYQKSTLLRYFPDGMDNTNRIGFANE